MLTYNYDTGRITRDFHFKKVEGDCKRDPERTVNIGIMALLAVFNDPDNIGSQTCQLALTDLYEQLKKLGVKEEPEYYQHFDPDC